MGRHEAATKARFLKRNALKRAGHEPRVLCETPVGERLVSDCLLEPLAAIIDGKNAPDLPEPMPDGLGEIAGGLNSHELAAAALAALLNAIYAGGNDRNPAAAIQQLKIKMGEYFYGLLAMKRLKTSADKKAREVAKRLEKGGKARKSDPLYPKNRLERRRQNSRR